MLPCYEYFFGNLICCTFCSNVQRKSFNMEAEGTDPSVNEN